MYLSVNPARNSILLNQWIKSDGKRIRYSSPVKFYQEPGRAKQVLKKARQRGLKLDQVLERLVGTKQADWLLNGG
jgi:hypothetical protein